MRCSVAAGDAESEAVPLVSDPDSAVAEPGEPVLLRYRLFRWSAEREAPCRQGQTPRCRIRCGLQLADNGDVASADVNERVKELADRVSGHPERGSEVVPELLALLRDSEDSAVLVAIVEAINQAWDEQASMELLAFISHPDSGVRRAVAKALPAGIESAEATDRVAEGLMRLCTDDDKVVRDWATFGLGTQLCVDTTVVRDLLWQLTSRAACMVDRRGFGTRRQRRGARRQQRQRPDRAKVGTPICRSGHRGNRELIPPASRRGADLPLRPM